MGFQNPQIQTYDLRRHDAGRITLTVNDAARSEPLHLDLGSAIAIRDWKETVGFNQEEETEQVGDGDAEEAV